MLRCPTSEVECMAGAEAAREAQGEVAWSQWRRRWWRRNVRRMDFKRELLPRLGETVGGFVLEARLGEGSYGTVYRARRGGRLYALKLLYLPHVEGWAWRELEVMLRVRRMGVVRVAGYGEWPDRSPLFLFIAMEYVEGLGLYDWARRHQPTARPVAEVLRHLARQLARVHGAGVVHRDVKGANVLVRQANGQPVLVDFGVGTYTGALEVTGPLVPGTALYRSPEALRFRRERQRGERYVASARDDLWALGVVLYWLLTGAYPFEGRDSGEGPADEGTLEDAILHQAPVPPHERNPRVPRTLSEVCLRLLEKAPEARFADAQAVDAALETALAGADASWEVVLGHEPAGEDSPDAPRGSSTPAPPTRSAPPTEAPSVAVPRAPVVPPQTPPEKRLARGRALAWGVPVVAGATLLALAHLPAAPPAFSPASPVEPAAPVPVARWTGALGTSGQEVALPWCPLEGAPGAAPAWAATLAPVARATLPKDMPVKTFREDSGPQRKPSQPQNPGSKALATALCAAAVGSAGCTGAQVRDTPKPEACPAGSLETMRQLGIRTGDEAGSIFPGVGGDEDFLAVREGPGARLTLEQPLGQLGVGTVLTGRLLFGKERVYGRFTQALTPGGDTWSVCLEAWGPGKEQGSDDERGFTREAPNAGPDTATVWGRPDVKAVERFE
ncbi:protein kinase domain-containing protein [Archangium sp.]|uniref:serine/threonine protein kinase n=1 Tax=Archangium sp. TaxID=1872627 RepID=UPI00286CA640|nr:protein kinase [Archangium sp.]